MSTVTWFCASNESPQVSYSRNADGNYTVRLVSTGQRIVITPQQLVEHIPDASPQAVVGCREITPAQLQALGFTFKETVEHVHDKVTVILDTRDMAAEEAERGRKFPKFRYMPAYFISRPGGLAIVLSYEYENTYAIVTRIERSEDFPGYYQTCYGEDDRGELEYCIPNAELFRRADHMTIDQMLKYMRDNHYNRPIIPYSARQKTEATA